MPVADADTSNSSDELVPYMCVGAAATVASFFPISAHSTCNNHGLTDLLPTALCGTHIAKRSVPPPPPISPHMRNCLSHVKNVETPAERNYDGALAALVHVVRTTLLFRFCAMPLSFIALSKSAAAASASGDHYTHTHTPQLPWPLRKNGL